jgi:2,4-dienoyl-CoA reductase-like NADH-dependent reductase (Old Yellow Enzyme family)/thioredoxin reductase
MSSFSALFQPGNIGTLQVKNRLIMPAMGKRLADEEGKVTEKMLGFYVARARGGTGLIIPHCAVVSSDSTLPFMMSVHEDSRIPDWRRLVDAVHEAGAKICIQLMHMGLLFTELRSIPEGLQIMVPSIMPWLDREKSYHELTPDEIEGYVDDFAQAARRVKEAGADAIELHACHGCLISTFLSPATNRRTDRYGGNVENRTRFARMSLERMREAVGTEFPVWVRMNATDDVEGGITIEEAIEQATIFEEAGADAISVSGGLEYWSPLNIPCYAFPDGPMISLAEEVKRAVKVPVIAAGKIGPEMAEQIVANGTVDFVAMGRPLMADPDLPAKLRQNRLEEIRRCIYCNNCLGKDPLGPISCSVNPFLSRETDYPLKRAEKPKKVMVIGGGLAGIQTALLLAERGHEVAVYEKNDCLGGQWNTARATPGKQDYVTLADYLNRSLAQSGISVELGTQMTSDRVLRAKPDAVVVATGAVPEVLKVPGATRANVVQGHDVIDGKVEPKGQVVVIGGRFIGMEVAIWLAEEEKPVCLVTRAGLGEDGIRLERRTFRTLAAKLRELRVPLYLYATVLEITDKAVVVALEGDIFSLPADTVILAVGMQPENSLAKDLEGAIPEVFTVGDCVRPRDAAEVAYQAAVAASMI